MDHNFGLKDLILDRCNVEVTHVSGFYLFSEAQEQRMKETDQLRKSTSGEHVNIDEHWSQTELSKKHG